MSIEDGALVKLTSIARSRTEPANRVERARILLVYRKNPSFFAVGQALGVHHQTVQRCVGRALAYGPIARPSTIAPVPRRTPRLRPRPRPGWRRWPAARPRTSVIRTNCGRRGVSAQHAREHAPAEGHPCFAKVSQGTVCKILNEQEIKPHKVR